MRNAHINMNEFANASRVLKQVNSLVRSKTFDAIMIVAIGSESLARHEIIMPGVELHRVHLISRGLPKSLIFQLIKYIEFFIRAVWLLGKFKPQVVNAHSLEVLPIACFCKIFYKTYLVYDSHELETEQVGGASFRKSLSKRLEKKLIYYHDLMFVVSESIADWYANEYNIVRPRVLLNAPKRRSIKHRNIFREQLDIRGDQIILLYQGGLAAGRGVHLILDAFKVRQDDRVVAVFMGYGPLQADIQSAANHSKNIFYYPAVAPEAVLEYTASADFGIHLIQNTCINHEYCMPNKLFEYAMAGLPVLVSNMKDMSRFVINNDMGAVVNDFSAASINQEIDKLLMQDLIAMKVCAYRAACENAWEVQEQAMLNDYQTMLIQKE